MEMFLLKVADVIIGVTPYSEKLRQYVRKYLAESGTPDFCVEITAEDVENESEQLALQRKVSAGLIDYDVLLFHSSSVAIDGFGYAFSAPSGTGKSTHTALLKRVYGDRVTFVNDDKPFIRLKNRTVTLYGAPWAGKHRIQNNISVPLKAIAFIERAEENSIEPMDPFNAFVRMMQQVYRPEGKEATERVIALAEKIMKTVPAYLLKCNMEPEAARVSFGGMGKIRFEDILNRDGVLVYKTMGISMEPMLHENSDVVVIKKRPAERLKKYDVVLFKRPGSEKPYVLHRILKVRENGYDIVGDNQCVIEKNVKESQILGVLESYVRKGKEISADSKKYRAYVHLWCDAYPLRFGYIRVRNKLQNIFKKAKKKNG